MTNPQTPMSEKTTEGREPERPPLAGISARAVLLGVLLVIGNNYFLTRSEMRTQVTLLSGSSIFIGVIFILLVLTLLNWVVRWAYRPLALRQSELLVIYIMLTMSSAVGGVGAFGWFFPFVTAPFWLTTPENKWEMFHRFLPSWFGPREWPILTPFMQGGANFFGPPYLSAWLPLLLLWGTFYVALLFVMLCLMAMVRRPWVEHERLNFPLVYLPVEMTNMEQGSFFRNKYLWIGVLLPTLIQSLNTLGMLYPYLPSMRINKPTDLGAFFLTPPWTGLAWTPFAMHPSVVGIGYLLSLEMSFSCWFFYLVRKALQVFGVAAGFRTPGASAEAAEFPFTAEQAYGAFIALALLSLYGSRRHLAAVFRKAFRGDPAVDDSGEPMSYRWAVLGAILGFGYLMAFCVASDMPWMLVGGFLLIFYLIMITLTRIVAETGAPALELMWVSPGKMLTGLLGPASFTPRGLTSMTALSWFNLDYRTAAMPHQMEAFKIASLGKFRTRPLVPVMMLAIVVGVAAAMIFSLSLYYTYGAETPKTYGGFVNAGRGPWTELRAFFDSRQHVRAPGLIAAGTGAAVTLALTLLRTNFVGFPLHPAAYALSTTYAIDFFWGPLAAAWLIKLLILRYGGMRMYRRAMPFFLGLILGDFATASFWCIVGAGMGVQLYRAFPN
jgi:hypothetical protein